MKPNYVFWNGYFPESYVNTLLSIVNLQETSEGKTLDPEHTSRMRDSQVSFINGPSFDNPDLRIIYLETKDLVAQANKWWNFDLYEEQHTVQLTKYSNKNSRYEWHNDSDFLFQGNDSAMSRKVSLSVVLQEAKKGGVFEMETGVEGYDHKPGSVIVFPSFKKHRVTAVEKGERISIVSWTNGSEWR